MNQISFTIKGKPVSTNRYKAPKVVRLGRKTIPQLFETKEAKDYKKWVKQSIVPQKEEMAVFESDYCVKENVLACSIVLWLPDLVTKDGKISKRSIDIDNSLKCLIDAIFDMFTKLDDKMICDLHVFKRKSEEFYADLTLHKIGFSNIK